MTSRKGAPKKKNTEEEEEMISVDKLREDSSLSRTSFRSITIEDPSELEPRPEEILDAMLSAWEGVRDAHEEWKDIDGYFVEAIAYHLARIFSYEIVDDLERYPDKYRSAVAQYVVEVLLRERLLLTKEDYSDDEDSDGG
jgi:hypothetical protein